jgi:NADH-quinone oxidoreductase subunit M
MGFVLLGLASLNIDGVSGAVLQMFSHGVVASLLFAVVGRMVYDRTHTRQLDELGGLRPVLPFAFWAFVVAGAASMGMPGFSGFVAELQVLIGAFRLSPWLVVGAGVGIVITVAYILHALHKVFFAEEEAGRGGKPAWSLPGISVPEKVAGMILMALLVIIGIYPSVMLDMIKANVELFLRGM